MWKFIRTHWSKYGEVPTAVTVKDNFPNYRVLAVEDTIEYLIDQLSEYRMRQHAIELIQDAATEVTKGDHRSALDVISRGIAKIYDEDTQSAHTDVNLVKDPEKRFDEYEAIKTRPNGLLGVSTGFKTIDEATAGLQPGQLVTIIAPPKTGKSVLAMQMAINTHKDGFSPVFQSFEMSNLEQQNRHDSMRANISHARLTRGTLKTSEEVRYRKSLEAMSKMKPFYLSDSVSAMSVSTISAKIEKLQPDLVFIDGVYLMIDEVSGESNTPQALTNITRSLKRMAQKYNLPVVITTQVLLWKMRKGNVSADSIGYSSSFFQDSDVILGLQRQDEEDDTSRLLRIVASRNCGPAETDLLWNWEQGKFAEYGS